MIEEDVRKQKVNVPTAPASHPIGKVAKKLSKKETITRHTTPEQPESKIRKGRWILVEGINAYGTQLEEWHGDGLCNGQGSPVEGKIIFGKITGEDGNVYMRLKHEAVLKTSDMGEKIGTRQKTKIGF